MRLSKLLQSKVMDVTFLFAEVKTCLDSVQSLRDNVTEGQHFSQVTAECTGIGVSLLKRKLEITRQWMALL